MNVTFKNVKTKMEITHDDYMVIHQAMCDLMDVGNKNVFEPGEVDNVWKKLNEVRTRLAKNVAHDIVEQEYNMNKNNVNLIPDSMITAPAIDP